MHQRRTIEMMDKSRRFRSQCSRWRETFASMMNTFGAPRTRTGTTLIAGVEKAKSPMRALILLFMALFPMSARAADWYYFDEVQGGSRIYYALYSIDQSSHVAIMCGEE